MNPMDEEGRLRSGFNIIEATNWYSYVSNNPLRYVDPTGEEAALLTDSNALIIAGHSAMYVETYDENGNSSGYALYEVGPITEEDRQRDASEPEGESKRFEILSGDKEGSKGGVTKEKFDTKDDMKERLERYDRILEFDTTPEQDKMIKEKAEGNGRKFGDYNLFTNNCGQYAARNLMEGDIIADPSIMEPNRSHDYMEDRNFGNGFPNPDIH